MQTGKSSHSGYVKPSGGIRQRYAALEWSDWFNYSRPLKPIGNILPVEEQSDAAAETIGMAG